MPDMAAIQFFSEQQQAPANDLCMDSGVAKPEWASISHGIYLSIGASGVHRSLGVRVSFVQSMTMDSWKPVHLKMMELGGNQRFQDFLDQHGVPRDMPIREKYQTRAAAWYRDKLRALAEGHEPPSPLEPGTGHLPASDAASETQKMLDEVFAKAPGSCAMTAGGIPTAQGRRQLPSHIWLDVDSPRKRCALATLMHKQLRSTIKSCKRSLMTPRPKPSEPVYESAARGVHVHEEEEEPEQCRSRSRSRSQSPDTVPAGLADTLAALAAEN